MQVAISSELTARIVTLAAANPAVEVCGLLLGTVDHVTDIVMAANVAADPARTFEVDPVIHFAAQRAARAGAPALVGCFHSHPSGNFAPSEHDCAMIGQIGELWLITDGQRVRAWRAATTRSFVEVAVVDAHAGCVTS